MENLKQEAAATPLTTTRLSGNIGAVVSGMDLNTVAEDDALFSTMHDALMQHGVLFFRRQSLSPEGHVALGARFGELHINPYLRNRAEDGFQEIIVLESGPKFPVVADGWHADVTFEAKPTMGSILHAVHVPDFGGDTMWSSMTAAYDALSEPWKQMLDGLTAVHDYTWAYGRFMNGDQLKAVREKTPPVTHPIVRTHPVTGRKGIFVNKGFTTLQVPGLKDHEGRAILEFLFDHVARPEFTCRWHWQPGDVAIWDNRCTQHTVVADNLTAPRRMERVTIMGDVPC